ncbi:MAG: glycosyl hydrolase [Planctomycetia bacterium]|nr:glycosyl hydrolase [Planctomycetia bacterium]
MQFRQDNIMSFFRLFSIVAFFSIMAVTYADPFRPKETEPKLFKNLKYRQIGPAAGGRVCRVAGIPGDALTYYAATASGGLWKSMDGGLRWSSIMDETGSFSIGSVAVAPANPNILYVGTGEANIRGNVCSGDGIFKSVDAGRTWKHVWKQKAQIGTIIVHPINPDICFAAVLGNAFVPSSERGVYRTTDGGKTWKKVLFHDDATGASDVCFDPNNPNILFAGMWQTRRRPWELTSGGPGSGLYISRDAGNTWQKLESKNTLGKETGLPEGIYGRVGIAVAASDSQRVYALIEAEKGGLFRSDDGGVTWKLASGDRRLRQRAWYYSTITIDSTNANVLWCPQVTQLKSIDGGKTFENVAGPHHGDHHDHWIDPTNPRRMINANDGGVDITVDGGKTWFTPTLPISQFYRIQVDQQMPYHVGGTMQDLGSAAGPSNTLAVQGIRLADWYPVGGGETGYVLFDAKNPNVVYAGEYAGIITRYDRLTRTARNVSIYPENPSGHGGEAMKYRFRWPAPIAGSFHEAGTLYHAANVLFRSRNGGQTWDKISDDLTRNDKSKQKWSGGPITGDNTTAEFYCTISAVAESPLEAGVIWAGSDDGLLHITRDQGKTWKNVTAQLPEFPEWGTIKMIEASRYHAGTAYVVVDAHLLGDTKPYLFKTKDYGQTWESLSQSMPGSDYLHVVREDTKHSNMLFVGFERGVYFSTDAGKSWQALKLNLPPVPVHDLIVKGNDLVLGTNGRSLWILDDISPVRSLNAEKAEEPVVFLKPEPCIRWKMGSSAITSHLAASFENPPYGAVLHYHLKKKPAKELKLVIEDAAGNRIISFEGKKDQDDKEKKQEPEEGSTPKPELENEPGLHRFVWNLSHERGAAIKGAVADMGSPEVGPPVNSGKYTARLIVDGKTYANAITVLPDPRIKQSDRDVVLQEKITLEMRGDIKLLTNTVETLRAVRSQLQSRNELLKDHKEAGKLVDASKKAIEQLDQLEEKLHNPKAKIAYDILAQRGGAKLYSRLVFLYNSALDGDDGPTQGELEVYIGIKTELKQCIVAWEKFKSTDLIGLNEQALKLSVPTIFVPKLVEKK